MNGDVAVNDVTGQAPSDEMRQSAGGGKVGPGMRKSPGTPRWGVSCACEPLGPVMGNWGCRGGQRKGMLTRVRGVRTGFKSWGETL